MVALERVQQAIKSPACCRRCNAADREWFVDLGYIEEFWGAVYYCNICFDELMSAGGYVSREWHDKTLNDSREFNVKIRHENERFHNLFSGLLDAGVDLYDLLGFLAAKEGLEFASIRKAAMDRRETELIEQNSSDRPTLVPLITIPKLFDESD